VTLRSARLSVLSSLLCLAACGGGGGGGDSSGSSASPPPTGGTPSAPTLTLTVSESTVAAGTAVTLDWSSSNTQSCSASGGWSGSRSTGGSELVTPVSPSMSYTLSCSGTGGSIERSVEVVVAPAPQITFTATPSSVASGESSTLDWSSTDAQSCSASGAWSGDKALSGSEETGPITSQSVYVLDCSGVGGTASQSVTVDVLAATNQAPQFLGTPFNLQATHGITTRQVAPYTTGSSDVAIAPDGKIVVAGWAIDDATSELQGLVVERYESNGLPDTTFGSDGRMLLPGELASRGGARIAVQTDGKILIAGTAIDEDALVFGAMFFLARLNADGTMDSTFGSGNGWVVTDPTLNDDYVTAIALQSDGRILVAGHLNVGGPCCGYYGIVRYTDTGELDATFGGQGGWPAGLIVYQPGDFGGVPKDLLVQPDGNVIVAGDAGQSFGTDVALLRMLPDGTLDSSFGSGGISYVYGCQITNGTCWVAPVNSLGGVALQPDGRIVVASDALIGSGTGVWALNVQRRGADGSPDPSLPITTMFELLNYSGASDVALQADGSVLVVASVFDGSRHGTSMLRLLPDGTPDPGYGTGDGRIDLPFSDALSTVRVALQVDDMSVLAGGSEAGITVARYDSTGALDPAFGQGNVLLAGVPFSFTYPSSHFSDPDGDPLSYGATLADGGTLPEWISFEPNAGIFSGTPPTEAQDISIRVSATDPGGLSASETFGLLVQPD
jgi:uncharacterized delta-60 repeat protein